MEDRQITDILDEIKDVEHGFLHITQSGKRILSHPRLVHFDLAVEFLAEPSYQVRMLGTWILGELSVTDARALPVLKNQVASDSNWRVQEMLAKAFDSFCQKTGYQQALPTIVQWLDNENANVKRAVVEGLRIWTGRPYFDSNPAVAIALITRHKADPSEYLRKSVGNALRDIGKKHSGLVSNELDSWDLSNRAIEFTYKFATKK